MFTDLGTVNSSEFKGGINDYLSRHAVSGQVTSLTDLIIFNTDNADEVMPFFGQELFEASDALPGLDNPAYPEAVERLLRLSGEEGILRLTAAFARYPHITVPMGLVDGLPVGLSVVCGPWQDATVLSIAYAYEQLE